MIKNKLDIVMNDYFKYKGTFPTEIRLNIDDFKKLVSELNINVAEDLILCTPVIYRDIKITWGIEY